MTEETVHFFENIPDPVTLLTSKEALNSITLFEKTVEVIGIVESVDCRENLFKFTLRNNEDDHVQVLAWGDEAQRIQSYVKMNFVTHIDAAFAKARNEIHSMGNTVYDLTVMSNTIVNVLKKIDNNPEVKTSHAEVAVCKIENIMDAKGIIAIEGYLNSSIVQKNLSSGANIGQSCLVDGIFKLEIRLQTFTENSFKEGEHVRVIGKIFNNGIPYIYVGSIDDISVISTDVLPLKELIKGTRISKRKSSEELNNKENADHESINKVPR